MKDLEGQFKNLQSKSLPKKQFKKELRVDLCREFDCLYPSFVIRWRSALAMPLAVIVIIVTMGTGTYAYASPEVNQNHALFPVKHSIEQLEMQLMRSPEAKAQYHARMMERRLEEGEIMFRKNQLTPEQLQFVVNELDLSVEQIEKCHNGQELREKLMRQYDVQNQRYAHLIVNAVEKKIEDAPEEHQVLQERIHQVKIRINEADFSEEEMMMFKPILDDELMTDFIEDSETNNVEEEMIEAELPDVELVEM